MNRNSGDYVYVVVQYKTLGIKGYFWLKSFERKNEKQHLGSVEKL